MQGRESGARTPRLATELEILSEPGRPRPRNGSLNSVVSYAASRCRCTRLFKYVLVMNRDVRAFLGPPDTPFGKRPTFAERLTEPALHKPADLFAMHFWDDVAQQMHMVGSRGADAVVPAAAVADVWEFRFRERSLFDRKIARRKFHAAALKLLAIRVTRHKLLIELVMLLVDRGARATVEACAVGAERDVPGGARRIEELCGNSLACGMALFGAGDGPARC